MAAVAVPKTSPNIDYTPACAEHHVWSSRQVFPMNAKPVTESVQHLPDFDFRFRVFAAIGLHIPAASVADTFKYHSRSCLLAETD